MKNTLTFDYFIKSTFLFKIGFPENLDKTEEPVLKLPWRVYLCCSAESSLFRNSLPEVRGIVG